jgi:transposase
MWRVGASALDTPCRHGLLLLVPDLLELPHVQLAALAEAQGVQIAQLTAANAAQGVRNEELIAANAELVSDNQILISVNETLTGKLSDTEQKLVGVEKELAKALHLLSRNSKNSSMPPSGDDQPGKTPPEPRKPRRDGPVRAKGKQRGAPGANLTWSDNPDKRRDLFPQGVCGCGAALADGLDLGVVERYQQTEIPPVSVTVTQYDQHAVRCSCGKVHTADRTSGAVAGPVGYGPHLAAFVLFLLVVHHLPVHRCAQLLESLTGAKPSVGYVHGLLKRAGKTLARVDARIRDLIVREPVVRMDETPIRCGPRRPRPGRKKAEKYVLVAVSDRYSYYLVGDRDLDTFKKSVLTELAAAGAVVVHDRYTIYDHAAFAADPDTGRVGVIHQLCCQHLCRDADGAGQVYPDEPWPDQIGEAPRGLIHLKNLARHDDAPAGDQVDPGHDERYCRYCQPQDRRALTEQQLRYLLRQGALVGLSATASHGDRPGESKARGLLECLRDRSEDVLRFLSRPDVPPTSNDAERALRPSKIQQNVSGRLTSVARTEDRYRIFGYVATAVKHGIDQFSALDDLMHGWPWMPPAAAAPT